PGARRDLEAAPQQAAPVHVIDAGVDRLEPAQIGRGFEVLGWDVVRTNDDLDCADAGHDLVARSVVDWPTAAKLRDVDEADARVEGGDLRLQILRDAEGQANV